MQFDSTRKIKEIRLLWDQGSLLKQIDVIGARAKNWPIRDGKDQARLIATSVASSKKDSRPGTAASASSTAQEAAAGKARSQSNNPTRDPHASLALFAPRNENSDDNHQKVTAPKASAKPPPRPYGDLFVGDESDTETRSRSRSPAKRGTGTIAPKSQTAKPAPRDYHDLFVGEDSPASKPNRAESPSKSGILSPTAPKVGGGKSYQPSRLFDMGAEDPATPKSPEKGIKPNSKKYHHFEFGDGDDAPVPDTNRPKTKHQSQWDFEDFMTPAKPAPRARKGDQSKRHFGVEDDDEYIDSPVKQQGGRKPRPDAASNFEFQDDGTPKGEKRSGTALGGTNARSKGLHQHSEITDEETLGNGRERPLSSIINVKDRHNDFNPHFQMTDDSPAHEAPRHKPMAVRPSNQSVAHWDLTDAETQPTGSKGNARLLSSNANKENQGHGRGSSNVGIKTGGDGMGGRAGSQRTWGFGDDSDS